MESLARFIVVMFISLLILGATAGLFLAWLFKSSWLLGMVLGVGAMFFLFWVYVSIARNGHSPTPE